MSTQNTENAITQLIDNTPIAPLQIAVVGVCFLIFMLDGFDVLAMSFAAPPIAEEWNLQAHQLGVVFSAALAGMLVGSIFLGPLADLVGRRPVILVSLAVVGFSMLFTSFVSELWQLGVLRVITGLGVGAILTSVTTTAAEYSPQHYRNMLIGLVQAGYPIGAVIGGLIAAQVIPVFGWRSVFIGGGLLTLLAAILAWFLIPESAQFLINKGEKDAMKKVNAILRRIKIPELVKLPPIVREYRKPTISSLLSPQYAMSTMRLWSAFILASTTIYYLLTWIPKQMVDSGLKLDQAIYVATAVNMGGAMGSIVLGRISVQMGLGRVILIFMFFGSACMLIIAELSLKASLLLFISFLVGFFSIGGFSGLYSVAARLYDTDIRATGIGWAIGLGKLGAVIGPVVGGILISAGFSADLNFVLFAVPLTLAGLLTVSINLKSSQSAASEVD